MCHNAVCSLKGMLLDLFNYLLQDSRRPLRKNQSIPNASPKPGPNRPGTTICGDRKRNKIILVREHYWITTKSERQITIKKAGSVRQRSPNNRNEIETNNCIRVRYLIDITAFLGIKSLADMADIWNFRWCWIFEIPRWKLAFKAMIPNVKSERSWTSDTLFPKQLRLISEIPVTD